jgi:hypothetical protein
MVAGLNSWVGALGADAWDNWDICKKLGMWGTGSNNGSGVDIGDEILVWKSQSGWLARCTVVGEPWRPTSDRPAPWGDETEYKWVFPIRVDFERPVPINPGSEDGRQHITGILNVKLGQFPKLSSEEREAVQLCLSSDSLTGIDGGSPAQRIEERIEESRILNDPSKSRWEKETLIMARTGQGKYRDSLLEVESHCRLTGLDDEDFLIASHIKPWAAANDDERVDGNNGLLLSPHVDRLFDRGWITFNDDGTFVASPQLDQEVLKRWQLHEVIAPTPFNAQQCTYLEYHRSVIFKR